MFWAPIHTFFSICRMHIVAIAAAGSLTFGWIFTGQLLWMAVVFCALDWFLVNLLNRVVDLDEDHENAIRGTDFVDRHQGWLTVFGFVALLLSFAIGALVCPEILVLRTTYHTLGVVYNWRLLPGRRRLKEMYFFKNTASALGFLLTVFAYPLALANDSLAQAESLFLPDVSAATICFAIAYFFLFEISYEILYDLRDIEGDRAQRVRSFPVVHGPRWTVCLMNGLLLTSTLVLATGYLIEAVPWRLFVLVLGPIGQWIWTRRMLRRGVTVEDCLTLTWFGVLLLVSYHLWWFLGLPGGGV
jgi:4-hydroxybenzoate polyprenyltransferase